MKRILALLACLAAASPAAAYEINANSARVTYSQVKHCTAGLTQAGSMYIRAGGQEYSRTYAPRPVLNCVWASHARTVELYEGHALITR